jgi:dTDP-4-amino-4,6-dideoxygalactose transaminase
VTASNWYILGQEGAAFEEEFASYVGAAHCIGVANGTDAIELALRALGVRAGSRVATAANAAFYTTTALLAIGAEPVYVDVDRSTHLIDLNHLAPLIEGRKIDAAVVTHLYGLMHDMDAVMRLVAGTGIAILEDCAQSHGARRGSSQAGSYGDAASFSFYPTKNLGALGDAGAVITNDADTAQRVRLLRQYGWASKYRVVTEGARNSRLDEMQAAVLRAKLPRLDAWNARRRAIARRYSEGISHPRVTCPAIPSEAYVAHLYVVAVEDRESLRRHLGEAGIATDIHYPIPDHLQEPIRAKGVQKSLPVTEALAQSILTLPCYPELSDPEVDQVIACVNAW